MNRFWAVPLIVLGLCICERQTYAQQLYWVAHFDEDNCCTGTVESAFSDGSRREVLDQGLGQLTYCWVDSEESILYWASWTGLHRRPLNGSGAEHNFSNFIGGCNGWLDFDFSANVAYVTQDCDYGQVNCRVFEIDLATGSQTAVAAAPRERATVDLAGGKIYWVEFGCPDFANQSCIKRSNLDGTEVELFYAGPTNSGIEKLSVDRSAGKLYWHEIDLAAGQTRCYPQRMNLDGSGLENLFNRFLAGERHYAVDTINSKVYWVFNGTMRRADFGGTNQENLFQGVASIGHCIRYRPPGVCQGTPVFADIIAPFASGGTVQPDFSDVGAIVDCFRQGANCDSSIRELADLSPCWQQPDECIGNGGLIDFADVSRAVDAFKGFGCR